MNEKKIEELVLKLIEKTKNKKAFWELTSRDNEFILNFENGGVITTDNWIQDGIDSVDLNIRNDKGMSIYSAGYNEVDNFLEYNFLKKLHQTAKASYFNVEDTLDNIFKDIDSDKIIGKHEDPDKLPW
jgi:hypothetical protein